MSDSNSSSSDSDDDDDILNQEHPFSLSQNSTSSAAVRAGENSSNDNSPARNIAGASNAAAAAADSSSPDRQGGQVQQQQQQQQQQQEVDEGEIARKAKRRAAASIDLLPKIITSPSELFWHISSTKGKKKYYPCRESTNPDEVKGLNLPQEWDASEKACVQYFTSAQCALGKFSVIKRSTLVPYHGRKEEQEESTVSDADCNDNNDENHIATNDTISRPTSQWCPQLCSIYETQMKKDPKGKASAMEVGVSIRAHMLFLVKILEHAKLAEEETKKLTASQKKSKRARPAHGMSSKELDRLLAVPEDEGGNLSGEYEDDPVHKRRKTELIRPGDVIEYYSATAVHGDKRYEKTAEVLSVDPKREPVLVLDTGDVLPEDHRVKRIRKMHRGKLQDCEGGAVTQPINNFKLSKASKEGAEGVVAGLKKEAKRVGGIINRNMETFREKVQADGFAPMDVMNTYKGAADAKASGDGDLDCKPSANRASEADAEQLTPTLVQQQDQASAAAASAESSLESITSDVDVKKTPNEIGQPRCH